ncbi:UMP kinase [Candidatus Woesearchaeota archaeon]|nr:UMP kinase [Candidatus Woesearchaeota archaeon]
MKKKTIIISLGGSLIVPDKIDYKFLRDFRKLIKSYLRKYKFAIITGGGKTARRYISAADKAFHIKDEDKDWLGIHATRLNAHLVRTIFEDVANSKIVRDPRKKVKFDKLLVGAGWRPGCSTDYDAVLLAKNVGAETVINMSNIDWLYDKDPRKYKSAKKIENIDWKSFKKIVGDKWKPGMNVPFDPKATKEAAKLGLKLVILGKSISNLRNYLDGKKFKGSVVE